MGGRGRYRTQRKHFRQSRENVWKRSKSDDSANATPEDANNNRHPNWEPFATQNPAFDEYYKEQEIVSAEEWDVFCEYLRKPLPAAFRINSSSQFYVDIRLQLENDFVKSLQAEDTEGNEVEAIKPLPWYPENLAWQSNYSRSELRKNQILERFHEFLKLENEVGNITRQEAVSMVPPLFLDVRPDHFVLDMCAAPGSKTFQLLEMIYKLTEPGTLPSGMVIANDLDVQRCNLLIHQTKRMCTANLIVTNHEAQQFPSCLHKNRLSDSSIENIKEPGIHKLQFDRVLCDVPCSGDGTLRKAPDIWRKWNPGMGTGLHGLQVQIAMRGIALLKVGGRMVYSTCSMNPVENEAVVAEVLRRCGGAVELVDVSSELPQLARRPGLKKWKIRDKGLWLASYKDCPKYRRSVITPGMFPSGKSYDELSECDRKTATEQFSENSDDNPENGHQLMDDSAAPTNNLEKEVSDLPLERCMRIVPHDQNSGAFFIAVLHKLSSLPVYISAPVANEKKSRSLPERTDSSSVEPRKQMTQAKEDKKGDDIDSSADRDVLISEATPNALLLDTRTSGTHLDTDQNKINEPNEKGETEMTEGEEDKNGDDIYVSCERDVQISEATADTDLPDTGMSETYLDGDESKINEQNEKEENEPLSDVKTDTKMVAGKRKLQMQGRWRGVDPVIFYKDDAVVDRIMEFYGIKESLPFKGHLITRNNDMNHVKRIYYVSNSVKEVLELNFLSGQQLKIASVGLKMFERQTSKEGASAPCIFRISSEGLPLILPHITKQILYASAVDFKHLLQYKSIKFKDLVNRDFAEQASNLRLGCCAVILSREGQVSSDSSLDVTPIAIGCWRGITSISVMVTALDCQELLERVSMLLLTEKALQADENTSIPEAAEEGKTNCSGSSTMGQESCLNH